MREAYPSRRHLVRNTLVPGLLRDQIGEHISLLHACPNAFPEVRHVGLEVVVAVSVHRHAVFCHGPGYHARRCYLNEVAEYGACHLI
jgi:hypothetical protein